MVVQYRVEVRVVVDNTEDWGTRTVYDVIAPAGDYVYMGCDYETALPYIPREEIKPDCCQDGKCGVCNRCAMDQNEAWGKGGGK